MSPADLVFANASLHWISDHETLFPRLMGLVAPGRYAGGTNAA